MKSDMENKEWADEEMSLKRFSKENPFTVPSGYFEEAGQRILSLVKLDELKSTDPANGFAVPAGYFTDLSANIQSRINIEAAVAAEQPGFAVPEGYFEQLTGNIQSRINIQQAVDTEEGFSVPQGYFNDLQAQINARIAIDEVLETPTEAFTVPEGYFETLNKNILNKTVNQNEVIRKTIVRKLFASNTFKYATAACLALIVGAGVFFNQSPATVTHSNTYLHSQVSEVPVDEIKDYLELHIDANDPRVMDSDKQINTEVLDEDLQDYIDMN